MKLRISRESAGATAAPTRAPRAVAQAAVNAPWLAQHQFGGALLGEAPGPAAGIGWSVTLSLIILRTRVLPRWLGVTGLVVSAAPAPRCRPTCGVR
jgi:hypothetical protein